MQSSIPSAIPPTAASSSYPSSSFASVPQKSNQINMNEFQCNAIFSFAIPSGLAYIYEGIDGAPIRDRVGTFNEVLRQVHLANNKSNESWQQLKELQQKLRDDPERDTSSNREKLKALYSRTVQDTHTESELSRKALALIFEIRNMIKQRQKKLNYGLNNVTHLRREQLMKLLTDCGNMLPLFIGNIS